MSTSTQDDYADGTTEVDWDAADEVCTQFTERTDLDVAYRRNIWGGYEFLVEDGFTCEFPWELDDYTNTFPRTDFMAVPELKVAA